ncbi:hypothetical protein MERGE_002448 [Pneumocystis wakefieldiae]|uniref:Stress response protein NST1 n=1 Tax=Pneumocystis wakefieldiae TaxID=38082 RepID=A0A899FWY3_9ASCO|nr:hypothetical protein MERGE_002448 [Pneumocystis wakefieldiae]
MDTYDIKVVEDTEIRPKVICSEKEGEQTSIVMRSPCKSVEREEMQKEGDQRASEPPKMNGIVSKNKKKKKKRTKQKKMDGEGSSMIKCESYSGGGSFLHPECKQNHDGRFLEDSEYDPASPSLSYPMHREQMLGSSFSLSDNHVGSLERKGLGRKKKKKKGIASDTYHSSNVSDMMAQPTSQCRVGSRKSKDQIWNISTHEERERIKEFWLQLGEEERRGLVKIEKEAVLRKMKEQQKHSCSCSVCDRKRIAIEEELEMLYDAYYEELEQYANQQQKFSSLSLLHKNSTVGRSEDLDDSEIALDSDGDYESIFLTVKGGIFTVADDLLKNDGKKFIEMMEQLAERRIQREEEAVMEIETTEFDSDDEDYDDESDDDELNTLDEEQRIEEGRRMFQIFAAKMFEQRVLTAYREKVAEERQQRLLEELEEENRLKEERELKKAREKERKKDKKKLQKQLKDQEKARKVAERLAEENALRIEEEKRLEEAKRKKEELRLKREAERKTLEEEKRRQPQNKEKEAEKERKRKEAEKERQKKELKKEKDVKEIKEAKDVKEVKEMKESKEVKEMKEVKEIKEDENKIWNDKGKDNQKQKTMEAMASLVSSNRSPRIESQETFYGMAESIKEARSSVSSPLNSSFLSLKTEKDSDNSLSSSSIIFPQSHSSFSIQNTSHNSPHMSSNINSTLQHPPGLDTAFSQNLSSTHSTYQPLTSHPIINNVSGGIFAMSSTSSNKQYDYSSSPLRLPKLSSNMYKNETSLSGNLNSYHSLPITPTSFSHPFHHHMEDKNPNGILGLHENRTKVLDDNITRILPSSAAKPIKRPSPIQRPSGTTAYKDELRKTPTINELSEVMGSKALLDDDDNDSIILNNVNDTSRGFSNRPKSIYRRDSPFIETMNLNRHASNPQESSHRNISDQVWLPGLSNSRFPNIWPSNTNRGNQYHVTQNVLRQRCKLICLRLDEQYGSKTRFFLIDQVLSLYNDLFSDTPVQSKQLLDACAISGNSQNGGGFFTCKIEKQHIMIRYDDAIDQTHCKPGLSGFPTMVYSSPNSPSTAPQSRWSINSSITGAF